MINTGFDKHRQNTSTLSFAGKLGFWERETINGLHGRVFVPFYLFLLKGPLNKGCFYRGLMNRMHFGLCIIQKSV